jgi:hypothetical protein
MHILLHQGLVKYDETVACLLRIHWKPTSEIYGIWGGARSIVVGWGSVLQAGRKRGRVPMRWTFFNLPNRSSRTMALGTTQPLTEMSTRNLPERVKCGRRVGMTTLPSSVSRLSRQNVGASTSHNFMVLHGLLQWWLFFMELEEHRGVFAVITCRSGSVVHSVDIGLLSSGA